MGFITDIEGRAQSMRQAILDHPFVTYVGDGPPLSALKLKCKGAKTPHAFRMMGPPEAAIAATAAALGAAQLASTRLTAAAARAAAYRRNPPPGLACGLVGLLQSA